MVARKLTVHHNDTVFDLDYDSDDGFEVFKFQIFSLTSVPPEQQKIYRGDCDDDNQLVLDDSSLVSLCDHLRLVSVIDENKNEMAVSDEELARILQAEEEALMLQQFAASEQQNSEIATKIRPYLKQVLMYEDPIRQDSARKTIPAEKLEEKALVALAKEGNFEPTKNEQDHAFLLQLLFWFKTSFSWVNAPPCDGDGCGCETTYNGSGTPLPSESLYGGARVELYRCNGCSRITRFPRYNDPVKLLETRKGRCGEWANCFTLYCRTFGYEARLILDFTDHVWTECFSPLLGRWMHLDPCEGIYDNPLLYEKGWKKKLDYVIAIARDGVYDVTKRYTRNWPEGASVSAINSVKIRLTFFRFLQVLTRRRITTEPGLSSILSGLSRECRQTLPCELVTSLEERDKSETEALDKEVYSKGEALTSLPGRISGDKQWRILRSECGLEEDSSSSSFSCPVRRCVDEHVTEIYNAFGDVIYQFAESSVPKSRLVQVLQVFRMMLVELKNNSPFKTRRTSLSASNMSPSQKAFLEMLPSFGKLLNALSLRSELSDKGNIEFRLAADPVRTSLALPVFFHALDDVVHHVNNNKYENIDKYSLCWPLLKLNRLCGGKALASGEELPFGIVTAAFDGTRMTKWEEPNGAKGCWVIYKLPDRQVHELVGYELMSANDAPERDPKDWVLEGSCDGGSTWHLIDSQESQIFENRFQRNTFNVKSEPFPANSFRFRFLAIREAVATTRFQIGSIDLYARS